MGTVARKCCALTRKGKPCPINANRIHDGQWYCHVHDPWGQYKFNLGRSGEEPARVQSEDHTLALFAPPTKEQMKVVKKRQSAWKRQAAQSVPAPSKSTVPPQPDEEPWYAQ